MAALWPMPSHVYINGKLVDGVKSIDIRIAVNEVQQATVVLLCENIYITPEGNIHISTETSE
jgi:hypothetical protein